MTRTGIELAFAYNLERIATDENFDLFVAGELLREGYFELLSIYYNAAPFAATDAERESITVFAQEHFSFGELCGEEDCRIKDF
jgi:hypothetical protein